MAYERGLRPLTDQLVTSLTGLTKEDHGSTFNSVRVSVIRKLKHQSWARTNQFDVADEYDGLVEKFRIMNKDVLADSLRARLDELHDINNEWIPELLSLFLQVADQPVLKARVSDLKHLHLPEPAPPLTWAKIDADDPLDNRDGVWDNVNFAGGDSEDETISTILKSTPEASSEGTNESRSTTPELPPLDNIESTTISYDDLFAKVRKAQFWQPGFRLGETVRHVSFSSQGHIQITELQAFREVLFMLRGLSGTLFKFDAGGEALIDKTYALGHSSYQTFYSILTDFATMGSKINQVRKWARGEQTEAPLRNFKIEIENRLCLFALVLDDIEDAAQLAKGNFVTSLMGLREQLSNHVTPLIDLSRLLSVLDHDANTSSYRHLELTFESACCHQAMSEDVMFKYMACLFLKSLHAYLRPVTDWMTAGSLDPEHRSFFVRQSDVGTDSFSWNKSYLLKQASSGRIDAPFFLLPFVQKIFVTGKSVQFLRSLGVDIVDQLGSQEDVNTLFGQDIWLHNPASSFVPFSEYISATMDKWISPLHTIASSELREQILSRCGLWRSLDALEIIYFARNGVVFNTIEADLFAKIDGNRKAWNDRYLLTELFQGALNSMASVDAERLVIRTAKQTMSRKLQPQSRSVNILRTIGVDYALPWPVANILDKQLLSTYQRTFTFLLQLRRARYVLQRGRLVTSASVSAVRSRSWILTYSLRHNLIWFCNALQTYITELVLPITSASIRRDAAAAEDVDAMIGAFRAYGRRLEDQCMLSDRLEPIRQAIIAILDLCVLFSDLVTSDSISQNGEAVPSVQNKVKSTSRINTYEESDSEAEDVSSSGEEMEGDVTVMTNSDPDFVSSLQNMKKQSEQLYGFVKEGLRGVSRAGGEASWDMLADMLEWKADKRR
ncbi:MAG: hypothetical protein M1834_008480 [Cirrosporium novae-zelandiae]|nr:MAG: hypothetical protein M1834_008480 [Cirrosporium novae-zelandiae]